MIAKATIAALVSMTALSTCMAAELTFKSKIQEITASPGKKKITVSFPFENRSDETIEISRHDAPCTCLNAKFEGDKKTYAPGEKGTVTAVFSLDKFYGSKEKHIVIWTKADPKDKPSIKLTTRVTIPEVVQISPKSLTWELDGEATTKTHIITINHGTPIHILEATCTNSNFKTEVVTINKGQSYEIKVTPANTSSPNFGILKIETDSKIPRFKHSQSFVSVQRANK